MIGSSSLSFIKMHGLGNDFVFLDVRQKPLLINHLFIKQLANRQRGIGCDQVIVIDHPSHHQATVKMRIFNADGNEVGACGNGTRCLGALLTRQTQKPQHFIETSDRILSTLTTDQSVKVSMGQPVLEWQHIPLAKETDPLFLPIDIAGLQPPVAVGMGNPHLVFFVKALEDFDLDRWGEELAHHPLFPEGTNVECVQLVDRHHVRMRVWERGTGITQSCATGACAVVVAGVLRGLLDRDVTVHLEGGNLLISYHDTVTVEGPVNFVFEGCLDADFRF